MDDLHAKIVDAIQDACEGDATGYVGGVDRAADAILSIPELDPTPTKQRILIALGGLRDNMTPRQVRTVQWFADQLPNA